MIVKEGTCLFLFEDLDVKRTDEFKQWAMDNPVASLDEVSEIWHPVCQDTLIKNLLGLKEV